jgi:ketosteroid isomerase-like protein
MAAESEFVKTFRQIYEAGDKAWNDGDFRTAFGALPEDVEWNPAPSYPEVRKLHGADEIVAYFEELRKSFPDVRTELREFIQVGERTVIVGFQGIGTGGSSGAGTTMDIWQVWEMREDLVPSQISEFFDRRAALEAAGAEESGQRASLRGEGE